MSMSGLYAFVPAGADAAIRAMLVASGLPFVFAVIAKLLGGFKAEDNANPRQFLQGLNGAAARANAVQQNSYESLPIFLAAVLIAMLFFVPQSVVNNLAWMYVLIRVGYGVAYISNLALFRSILWALSMACCVLLFYLSIRLAA